MKVWRKRVGNRMRIQFFKINSTCWMNFLHILHGHFPPFHFPISFLKMLKEDAFLIFSDTRFHIWGPLYLAVSVLYFTVLLFVEHRHWKSLRLYLLFHIMKVPFIIGGAKPFKNVYISLARLSKLFWCNVFSLVISRMTWKVLTWSLRINLRARLWIRLIRLFKECEQNIHISRQ